MPIKNIISFLLLCLFIISCVTPSDKTTAQTKFLTTKAPTDTPLVFAPVNVPADRIIHRGIFSPDFKQYFYTLSDLKFRQFNVMVTHKKEGKWSVPLPAFFNSEYNEHGMSFSADGKQLYFSSTRPTGVEGIPDTWHLWRSTQINGQWTEPEFVDIPNLRDRLVSHPTLTSSGGLYFHASQLDYSEMDLYYAPLVDGIFQEAKTVLIPNSQGLKCTPYVSPSGDYLIYAALEESLQLVISFKDEKGNWQEASNLGKKININGQGNPYVSPDGQYLFYASGTDPSDANQAAWSINWVSMKTILQNISR